MEHLPDIKLPGGDSAKATPKKRPQLDTRGFTERGGADSPNLLAVDQTDDSTVERVRTLSASL